MVAALVGLTSGLISGPVADAAEPGSQVAGFHQAAAGVGAAPPAPQVQPPPAPAPGAAPAARPFDAAPKSALRVVIDSEPAHLNPVLEPDLWGYRIAHDLICEPLVRRRVGGAAAGLAAEKSAGAARYEPVLAERFRIDADGHGIELWIRRGVRFHDGRPLTAFDVRATLDMVRTAGPSAPRTQALLADIVRIQVANKDQLRIDLRHGSRRPSILAALSEIDILPASYFPTGRLIHQPFNRRPIGTGPYRLAEWRRGSQLILRKNPTYWGPAPASEELRFRIASDGAHGLSLLRQGEAEVLARVSPRYLADQVEPAVQRGRFRKLELDANQAVMLLPNGRHPLLGEVAVRRAVERLIDHERERLVRDVRRGLGTPLRLPLPGDAEERLAGGPDATPPKRDDSGVAAAEVLLNSAGVQRVTPDGPRQFQGRPVRLRLLVPAGATELQDVAKRLGDVAAKVGLKLDSELVDLPTFIGRLRRGTFELALLAWSWTGDSSELDVEPLLGYVLPLGHPLLAELTASFAGLRDGAEPARAASRLLARWQESAPLFLLYRPRQVVLLSPQLEPASPPVIGDFIDLKTLVRPPLQIFNTALR